MSTVDHPSLDPCLHMQFSSFLPMPIEWLCVLLDPPAFQDLQVSLEFIYSNIIVVKSPSESKNKQVSLKCVYSNMLE